MQLYNLYMNGLKQLYKNLVIKNRYNDDMMGLQCLKITCGWFRMIIKVMNMVIMKIMFMAWIMYCLMSSIIIV